MSQEKPILVALELTKALIRQQKVYNWQTTWNTYLGIVEGISQFYCLDYEEPFELTMALIEAGRLESWEEVCTAYSEIAKQFYDWRSQP